jgi:hypothetical protein
MQWQLGLAAQAKPSTQHWSSVNASNHHLLSWSTLLRLPTFFDFDLKASNKSGQRSNKIHLLF